VAIVVSFPSPIFHFLISFFLFLFLLNLLSSFLRPSRFLSRVWGPPPHLQIDAQITNIKNPHTESNVETRPTSRSLSHARQSDITFFSSSSSFFSNPTCKAIFCVCRFLLVNSCAYLGQKQHGSSSSCCCCRVPFLHASVQVIKAKSWSSTHSSLAAIPTEKTRCEPVTWSVSEKSLKQDVEIVRAPKAVNRHGWIQPSPISMKQELALV
jgi:hypothetical protein